MACMGYFGDFLKKRLDEKGLSLYRLVKDNVGIDHSILNKVVNGVRMPSDSLIQTLAGVKDLGLSEETLKAWRFLDEEPEAALSIAEEVLKHGKREC